MSIYLTEYKIITDLYEYIKIINIDFLYKKSILQSIL